MTGIPPHSCQGEWLSLSLLSPGQQLDEILQLAVNRMEPSLAEGPRRTQALTLLLWVRPVLDEWGRGAGRTQPGTDCFACTGDQSPGAALPPPELLPDRQGRCLGLGDV